MICKMSGANSSSFLALSYISLSYHKSMELGMKNTFPHCMKLLKNKYGDEERQQNLTLLMTAVHNKTEKTQSFFYFYILFYYFFYFLYLYFMFLFFVVFLYNIYTFLLVLFMNYKFIIKAFLYEYS